jgi:hypothetical protein
MRWRFLFGTRSRKLWWCQGDNPKPLIEGQAQTMINRNRQQNKQLSILHQTKDWAIFTQLKTEGDHFVNNQDINMHLMH